MRKDFKKQGGGEYGPFDLVKLSFDKEDEVVNEKPSLETFAKLVNKYGKRKNRDGGK